jgi:hypothetical protein
MDSGNNARALLLVDDPVVVQPQPQQQQGVVTTDNIAGVEVEIFVCFYRFYPRFGDLDIISMYFILSTSSIFQPPRKLTTEQLNQLEAIYSQARYISLSDRQELARSTGVSQTRIKIWFQNRRYRARKIEERRWQVFFLTYSI